ncbi:MAG: hypothetical protein IT289_11310 [Oligoflexia bacterium]|nr:hypothetical protein [Oligoflexia bacterium]
MRTLSLIFNLFICLSLYSTEARAQAFENLPEFTFLTENEQTSLDDPRTIDPEYAGILLTYSRTINQELVWAKSRRIFDGALGSLNGTQFWVENRARFMADLNESLEFKFYYLDERNLESEQIIHVPELIYKLSPRFGFSVYGELSFYKRQNDVGFSLFWRPQNGEELKFFGNIVDFTRNDRNDRRDRFENGGFPYSAGLIWRSFKESERAFQQEMFNLSVRYETPTVWTFPDALEQYEFHRISVQAHMIKPLSPQWRMQGQAQLDQKREAKSPWGSLSTVSRQSVRTDRIQSRFRFEYLRADADIVTGFGLAANSRRWEKDAGPISYVEAVPFLYMTVAGFERVTRNDLWTIEVDYTFHRQSGVASFRSRPDDSLNTETRLLTAYDFVFPKNATLRLAATWDIQRLFKNKFWGGGMGEFAVEF